MPYDDIDNKKLNLECKKSIPVDDIIKMYQDGYISDGYISDGYISDGYISDGYISDGYISDGYEV